MDSQDAGSSSSATNLLAASASYVQVGDATIPFRAEWDRHRLTPRHTAYLRVAEGCNHACTFCAIPGFRCGGSLLSSHYPARAARRRHQLFVPQTDKNTVEGHQQGRHHCSVLAGVHAAAGSPKP